MLVGNGNVDLRFDLQGLIVHVEDNLPDHPSCFFRLRCNSPGAAPTFRINPVPDCAKKSPGGYPGVRTRLLRLS
jgi:hypothetical protein